MMSFEFFECQSSLNRNIKSTVSGIIQHIFIPGREEGEETRYTDTFSSITAAYIVVV